MSARHRSAGTIGSPSAACDHADTAPAAGALPVDVATRASYFLGAEGVACLSPEQALAFTGLLEASRRLTRELEGELELEHGLSFSALGLLGRLAAAPDRMLRLTILAQDMGLSLSRVSRVVDGLEARGLLERRPCPADARAINARLTEAGAALASRAQATHREGVKRRFFEKLSAEQVAILAGAFLGLLDGAQPRCVTDE
jgi:DNA-binding MarR family transcriptional regulator